MASVLFCFRAPTGDPERVLEERLSLERRRELPWFRGVVLGEHVVLSPPEARNGFALFPVFWGRMTREGDLLFLEGRVVFPAFWAVLAAAAVLWGAWLLARPTVGGWLLFLVFLAGGCFLGVAAQVQAVLSLAQGWEYFVLESERLSGEDVGETPGRS